MKTRSKTRAVTEKCKAKNLIPEKVTQSQNEASDEILKNARKFLDRHRASVVDTEAGPSNINLIREKNTQACKRISEKSLGITKDAGHSDIDSTRKKVKQLLTKKPPCKKKGVGKTKSKQSLIPGKAAAPDKSQIYKKLSYKKKRNVLLNTQKKHVTFSDDLEVRICTPSESGSNSKFSSDYEDIENDDGDVPLNSRCSWSYRSKKANEPHICHFDTCPQIPYLDLVSSSDEEESRNEVLEINQIDSVSSTTGYEEKQKEGEVENGQKNFVELHSLENDSQYFCCRMNLDESGSHDDGEENQNNSSDDDKEVNVLLTRMSLSHCKKSPNYDSNKQSDNNLNGYYNLFSDPQYSVSGTPDMFHFEEIPYNQDDDYEKMEIGNDNDMHIFENADTKYGRAITESFTYDDLLTSKQEKLNLLEIKTNDQTATPNFKELKDLDNLETSITMISTQTPRETFECNDLYTNKPQANLSILHGEAKLTKAKILDNFETITKETSKQLFKCSDPLRNEQGKPDLLETKQNDEMTTPSSKETKNIDNSETIIETEDTSTLKYFEELETLVSSVEKEKERNKKLSNWNLKDKPKKMLNEQSKEHMQKNKNLNEIDDTEEVNCISRNQNDNKTSEDQICGLRNLFVDEKKLNYSAKKSVSSQMTNEITDLNMIDEEPFQKEAFSSTFMKKLKNDKILLNLCDNNDDIQIISKDDSADDFRNVCTFSRPNKQIGRKNVKVSKNSNSVQRNRNSNSSAEENDVSVIKDAKLQPKAFESNPIDYVKHYEKTASKHRIDIKPNAEQSPNSLGSEELFSDVKFSEEAKVESEMTNPFLASYDNLNSSQNIGKIYSFQLRNPEDKSKLASLNSSTEKEQMDFMNFFKNYHSSSSVPKSKPLKTKSDTKQKTKKGNEHHVPYETSKPKMFNPNSDRKCAQKCRNVSPIKNVIPSDTVIGSNQMSAIANKGSLVSATTVKSKSTGGDSLKMLKQDQEIFVDDSGTMAYISNISPTSEKEGTSKLLQASHIPKYKSFFPQCSTPLKCSKVPLSINYLKREAYNFGNKNFQMPSRSFDVKDSTSHDIDSPTSMTTKLKVPKQTGGAEVKLKTHLATPIQFDTKGSIVTPKYKKKELLNTKINSNKRDMQKILNEGKRKNLFGPQKSYSPYNDGLDYKAAIPETCESNPSSNCSADFLTNVTLTNKGKARIGKSISKSKKHFAAPRSIDNTSSKNNTIFKNVSSSSSFSEKSDIAVNRRTAVALKLSSSSPSLSLVDDSFSSVDFKGNDIKSVLSAQKRKECKISPLNIGHRSDEVSQLNKIQSAAKMKTGMLLPKTLFPDKATGNIFCKNSGHKQDFIVHNPKPNLSSSPISKTHKVKQSFSQKRENDTSLETEYNKEPHKTFLAQADMQAEFIPLANQKRRKLSNSKPSALRQKVGFSLDAIKPSGTFQFHPKELPVGLQKPTMSTSLQRHKPEKSSPLDNIVAGMRQCAGFEQQGNKTFMPQVQSKESLGTDFGQKSSFNLARNHQNPKPLSKNIITQTDIFAVKSTTTIMNTQDDKKAKTSYMAYEGGDRCCFTGKNYYRDQNMDQLISEGDGKRVGENIHCLDKNFYKTAINAVSDLTPYSYSESVNERRQNHGQLAATKMDFSSNKSLHSTANRNEVQTTNPTMYGSAHFQPNLHMDQSSSTSIPSASEGIGIFMTSDWEYSKEIDMLLKKH